MKKIDEKSKKAGRIIFFLVCLAFFGYFAFCMVRDLFPKTYTVKVIEILKVTSERHRLGKSHSYREYPAEYLSVAEIDEKTGVATGREMPVVYYVTPYEGMDITPWEGLPPRGEILKIYIRGDQGYVWRPIRVITSNGLGLFASFFFLFFATLICVIERKKLRELEENTEKQNNEADDFR